MTRKKMLLVGQAPSRTSPRGAPAFSGRNADGFRFCRLVGRTWAESVGKCFDTVNLLSAWPGRAAAGKGDAFDMAAARTAAAKLLRRRRHRVVLLAGRRVAEAFGLRRYRLFEWLPVGRRRMCVVPHPSGVSHWWNDKNNVALAAGFFAALMRGKATGRARHGA